MSTLIHFFEMAPCRAYTPAGVAIGGFVLVALILGFVVIPNAIERYRSR